MKRFLNWLADKISPQEASHKVTRSHPGQPVRPAKKVSPRKLTAVRAAPKSAYVKFDATVSGEIVDAGPGKNVLKRSKFVREDSGTHDSLSIIDESAIVENNDEEGIDPYNTGRFDRSKNWDKRFRKD